MGLIPEIKERFEAATVSVKQTAVKGFFAKDVATALITGSVFLILGGSAYGLAQFFGPALAAVAVGGFTISLITIFIFLASNSFKKN